MIFSESTRKRVLFRFYEQGVTFFEQKGFALDNGGMGWYIVIEGGSRSRHYAGDSSIIPYHPETEGS